MAQVASIIEQNGKGLSKLDNKINVELTLYEYYLLMLDAQVDTGISIVSKIDKTRKYIDKINLDNMSLLILLSRQIKRQHNDMGFSLCYDPYNVYEAKLKVVSRLFKENSERMAHFTQWLNKNIPKNRCNFILIRDTYFWYTFLMCFRCAVERDIKLPIDLIKNIFETTSTTQVSGWLRNIYLHRIGRACRYYPELAIELIMKLKESGWHDPIQFFAPHMDKKDLVYVIPLVEEAVAEQYIIKE